MNFLKFTHNKLDLNEINSLIIDESCSGVSFFVETTCDSFEDKKVVSVGYEAADTIELQCLTEICDQMRTNWTDIKHIAMYHRLGLVPVKDASIIIGISSLHRQTSMDAVQYAIEELKKTVRICKTNSDPAVSLKRKLPLLNFDECQVHDVALPKYLVQIGVDETEVNRRVNCFVERKREEIDINNIKDFIDSELNETESEYSCARVNSSVYRKDSGSYFKVHRVRNEHGPQTKTEEYMGTLDKLMFNSPKRIKQEIPSIVPLKNEERLENAERFLNIKPEGVRTIYERIKRIEDRILHLETVSPEYNHFIQKNNAAAPPKVRKKTYSTTELDGFIHVLQQSNYKNKLDN